MLWWDSHHSAPTRRDRKLDTTILLYYYVSEQYLICLNTQYRCYVRVDLNLTIKVYKLEKVYHYFIFVLLLGITWAVRTHNKQ